MSRDDSTLFTRVGGYAFLTPAFLRVIFPVMTDEQRSLFVLLTSHAPNIRPGLDSLASRLGKARRSVERRMSELVRSGVLLRIAGGGRGHSAEYRLPRFEDDEDCHPIAASLHLLNTSQRADSKRKHVTDDGDSSRLNPVTNDMYSALNPVTGDDKPRHPTPLNPVTGDVPRNPIEGTQRRDPIPPPPNSGSEASAAKSLPRPAPVPAAPAPPSLDDFNELARFLRVEMNRAGMSMATVGQAQVNGYVQIARRATGKGLDDAKLCIAHAAQHSEIIGKPADYYLPAVVEKLRRARDAPLTARNDRPASSPPPPPKFGFHSH